MRSLLMRALAPSLVALTALAAATAVHAQPAPAVSGAPSAPAPAAAAPAPDAPAARSIPGSVSSLGALRAHESILKLDLDEARSRLAPLAADDPDVVLERALLAVYEGDCDAALVALQRAGLDRRGGGPAELGALARGCAHVVAA
ncbi:MAG: hypothetical protein EOO75_12920, partial [Myxococcales bacterium]